MRFAIALACLVLAPLASAQTAGASLAQRLGYSATDKLLIVKGDDVGMSHAANAATIEALERGLMTSASIMVPCPWFPEIARYARANPRMDFGLHLTLTSEWKGYRWGPVASADEVVGLIDPDGYLWPDVPEVYASATPEEGEVEVRAQIAKALAAGIDVTHLDSHMGTLQYADEWFQVYRKVARHYDLPLRMGSADLLERLGGKHQREQLAADGVLCPDFLVFGERKRGEAVRDYWLRVLADLRPGVTEIYIHAALAGEEMRHITGTWQERAAEHELFTNDPEVRRVLEAQGVRRIGYRALRDLQRREREERAR